MQSGTGITLKFSYDYIEDSVLVHNCQDCFVYLIADQIAHKDSFVKLKFRGTICVRSARTDCSPAIGIYPKKSGVSSIVELKDSKWPKEAHALYTYSDSRLKPRGRHFVITNHDIFHEILAESFTESLIHPGDSEYDFIKQHFS